MSRSRVGSRPAWRRRDESEGRHELAFPIAPRISTWILDARNLGGVRLRHASREPGRHGPRTWRNIGVTRLATSSDELQTERSEGQLEGHVHRRESLLPRKGSLLDE